MISVIVPVYNEEAAVLQTLLDIDKELDGFVEHEIIIVDDGSTDKTLEKVSECGIKNLTVINHPDNLGYGKALLDGIVNSKYDCIAIIDGDGSYAAKDIKRLYEYYPQYDMVVGARRGKEYKKGILIKPARMMFNYLAEYAAGKKIPDVNSGLRVFKKDIFMEFQEALCTGFSFTTTLTLVFSLNHYFVKYVQIDYLEREGKSKVKYFRDTLRAGQIIVETISEYNPTKLFLLFATLNSIFGLTLGFFNHFIFKIEFLSTISAICVSSFIPIFCMGLLLRRIKKIYRINKK